MEGNEKAHIQPLTTREKKKQCLHNPLAKPFQPQIAVTRVKKEVNTRALSEEMRLLKAFTCNSQPPFTSF